MQALWYGYQLLNYIKITSSVSCVLRDSIIFSLKMDFSLIFLEECIKHMLSIWSDVSSNLENEIYATSKARLKHG